MIHASLGLLNRKGAADAKESREFLAVWRPRRLGTLAARAAPARLAVLPAVHALAAAVGGVAQPRPPRPHHGGGRRSRRLPDAGGVPGEPPDPRRRPLFARRPSLDRLSDADH